MENNNINVDKKQEICNGEKKRILILTVLAGLGHIHAGEAICEGIKEVAIESVEIKMVNPLVRTNPFLSWFINTSYLLMAKYTPNLWGWFYDSSIFSSPHSPLRWLISAVYTRSIKKEIDDFMPNVIVSTHVFTTDGTAKLKRHDKTDAALISVATDYDVHPFGMSSEVDIFIVPGHRMAYRLEATGIAEEKIRKCGIPIGIKFSKPKTNIQNIQIPELIKGLPVVLLLSGGFGMGPIEQIIKTFAEIKRENLFQLVVVTGKNESLRKRVEKITQRFIIPVHTFGFVNNMETLMDASELIITKPGGISSSEAISRRIPLIFISPVRGQEIKNIEFLIEEGVALYPKKIKDIPRVVVQILGNQRKLKMMHDRLNEFGKPRASIDIAKVVLCQASING